MDHKEDYNCPGHIALAEVVMTDWGPGPLSPSAVLLRGGEGASVGPLSPAGLTASEERGEWGAGG